MVSQSHQRVIDTATRLFSQKSFAAVSMRDLARALGIAAPSIYSFVPSKEALLRECVEPYILAVKELVDGPSEGISALVLGLFKIYENHTEEMILTHRDPACYGDATIVDDWCAGQLLQYDIPRELAWPVLALVRDPWMRPGPPSEEQLAMVHRLVLRTPDCVS